MKLLIGLGLLMLTLSIDGKRCKKDSQCDGGFCNGGHIWSWGTCAPLRPDGSACLQGVYANSCQSKRCVCNHCPDRYGKHQNNYRCSTNANCKSGWCQGRSIVRCGGTCRPKGADSVACSDNNYCSSGQCTCGRCGRKVNNGEKCSTNDNCRSGWCHGKNSYRGKYVGCLGTCLKKKFDGEKCSIGQHCYSGLCICGKCGRKRNDGKRCLLHDNCRSGWCDGQVTRWGCPGTCLPKVADGVACTFNGYCSSGQCTCGRCGRKVNNGQKCSTNDNCRSGWCHGKYTLRCRGACFRKS